MYIFVKVGLYSLIDYERDFTVHKHLPERSNKGGKGKNKKHL